jgi:hypothetical protein
MTYKRTLLQAFHVIMKVVDHHVLYFSWQLKPHATAIHVGHMSR